MLGKIALEEAYEEADHAEAIRANARLFVASQNVDTYVQQMTSISDLRLEISRKHGIGYTILSRTGPAVQNITDRAEAEKEATRSNDWLYEQIKDHRDQLGAFAALSMHDPVQAGEELRRCVQMGFHGALVYDYQYAGEDLEYKFYDQPEYDAFWAVRQELNVPLYIHPSAPVMVKDPTFWKQWSGRKYLVGPPLSFASGVAQNLTGILINGVFDRFPNLKIIVGHLGERIPFDFDRTNRWIQDVEKPLAKDNGDQLCQQDDILYYFKNNIWLTTSGHFHTPTLKYVCDYLGAERILFSVDYPYETPEAACAWFDGDAEAIAAAVGGEENYYKIGRENAKTLFGLKSYYQSDA
nr:salicylate decarboxylase [Quercus suber]